MESENEITDLERMSWLERMADERLAERERLVEIEFELRHDIVGIGARLVQNSLALEKLTVKVEEILATEIDKPTPAYDQAFSLARQQVIDVAMDISSSYYKHGSYAHVVLGKMQNLDDAIYQFMMLGGRKQDHVEVP